MQIVLRHFLPLPTTLRAPLRKMPRPGLVSEVVYHEDQPMMAQLLLLPLLRQLGQQSRWQLWLTPQQKLSREWVQSSGLPLTKVMQISQLRLVIRWSR
ncbi:cell division inhibitor [Salmonella enterica subsp. enterica]|uniref:Cell division inhibitor n=1 Tax=Salmonella enterica I TaxID=59201 RepID=A0A379WCC1_SALET|nr:cell division inhibitor [Salmonella enterica subsp. enterica]